MDRGRGRNRGGGGGGRHYASRGRSPRPTGHYVVRRSPVVAHPDGALPLSGSSEIGRINSEIPSVDGVTKDFSGLPSSDYPHGSNAEPHVVGNMSPNNGNSKLVERVSEAENQTPKPLDLPSVVGPGYGSGFPSIPSHSELRGGNCGGRGGGRYYASRGRSPLSTGRNVVRRSPVVAHPDGASPGSGSSEIGQLNSEISSGDPYGPSAEPHGVRNMSPYNGNPKLVESVSEAENQTPKPLDLPSVVGPGYNNGFRSLPTHSELRGGNRGDRGGGRHYASRGRAPRSTGRYIVRHSPVVARPDGASPGIGSSEIGRINSEISSAEGVTKKINGLLSSGNPYGPSAEPSGVVNTNNGNPKVEESVSEAENQTPKPLDLPSVVGPGYGYGFSSLPTHSELSGGRGGRGGGRYYAPRGRSPRSSGRNAVRRSPVVAHPDGASPGSGYSEIGRINSELLSVDGVTKKFNGLLSSDYPNGPNAEPHGVGNMSPNNGNPKVVDSVSEAENQTPKPLDLPSVVGPGYSYGFPSFPTHSELRGGNRGGGGGGRYYAPRGRSPRSTGRNVVRRSPVAHPDGASPGSGSSEIGKINSEISSVDGVTKKFSGLLSSDYLHGPNAVPHGVGNMSPNNGNSKLAESVSEAENQTPKPLDLPSVVGPGHNNVFSSLPTHSELNATTIQEHSEAEKSWDQDEQNQTMDCGLLDGQVPQEFQRGKCTSEVTGGKGEYEKSDFQQYGFSFDICEERDKNIPKLKTPLLVKNRAMRSEMKRQAQGVNIQTFRSGMILLKGYISLKDQVKLIKSCRDLGRGHGGFYQPGYRDGAKLHLKMMCLGKNWDPETSMYGDKRPIDDAKPPPIPDDFQQMVKEALQECHGYLESHSKVRNVRDILPSMSPSICIINFYTNNGKLGLHQDKDESQESIRKRLPVVSLSLGDSAEFLYGEQRDIDKADKVVLESGDVLVFGGESRLIFHGVSNIIPDTAPKPLLEETNLRPGRLNLTFREY